MIGPITKASIKCHWPTKLFLISSIVINSPNIIATTKIRMWSSICNRRPWSFTCQWYIIYIIGFKPDTIIQFRWCDLWKTWRSTCKITTRITTTLWGSWWWGGSINLEVYPVNISIYSIYIHIIRCVCWEWKKRRGSIICFICCKCLYYYAKSCLISIRRKWGFVVNIESIHIICIEVVKYILSKPVCTLCLG